MYCTYDILSHCWNDSDKELWSISIRACIGHADSERSIVFQSWMKFIFKFSAPYRFPSITSTYTQLTNQITIREDTGSMCTCWVTRLNHKFLNNSVKYVTIIITITWMNTKIFNCFRTTRRERGKYLTVDIINDWSKQWSKQNMWSILPVNVCVCFLQFRK